jgi:hypothetical protein
MLLLHIFKSLSAARREILSYHRFDKCCRSFLVWKSFSRTKIRRNISVRARGLWRLQGRYLQGVRLHRKSWCREHWSRSFLLLKRTLFKCFNSSTGHRYLYLWVYLRNILWLHYLTASLGSPVKGNAYLWCYPSSKSNAIRGYEQTLPPVNEPPSPPHWPPTL